MIPKLFAHTKFQDDLRLFKETSKKIENPQIKLKFDKLVQDLISEVRKIDNTHQEMIFGNQLPQNVGDYRERVTSIRKQIDTMIKDLNR